MKQNVHDFEGPSRRHGNLCSLFNHLLCNNKCYNTQYTPVFVNILAVDSTVETKHGQWILDS